jgi:hypothetical protein
MHLVQRRTQCKQITAKETEGYITPNLSSLRTNSFTSFNMPGPGNDALAQIFKVVAERIAANPNMDLPTLRASLEEFHKVSSEPTEVMYEETTIGSCPALWEIPVKAKDSPNVILYLQYEP